MLCVRTRGIRISEWYRRHFIKRERYERHTRGQGEKGKAERRHRQLNMGRRERDANMTPPTAAFAGGSGKRGYTRKEIISADHAELIKTNNVAEHEKSKSNLVSDFRKYILCCLVLHVLNRIELDATLKCINRKWRYWQMGWQSSFFCRLTVWCEKSTSHAFILVWFWERAIDYYRLQRISFIFNARENEQQISLIFCFWHFHRRTQVTHNCRMSAMG